MIYSLDNEYFLRALQLSDLEGPYPMWFEDQEVCKYNSHGKYFNSLDYYRHFIESIDNESHIVWAICNSEDGHIGNISLQNISTINRNAEFAIILGNKNHWGKGVGYKVSAKIIYHGFHKLNLHKVYCGTPSINTGMINLAKKLGMVEEGQKRSHIFLDNKWHDIIEFGLLKEDFECNSNMLV